MFMDFNSIELFLSNHLKSWFENLNEPETPELRWALKFQCGGLGILTNIPTSQVGVSLMGLRSCRLGETSTSIPQESAPEYVIVIWEKESWVKGTLAGGGGGALVGYPVVDPNLASLCNRVIPWHFLPCASAVPSHMSWGDISILTLSVAVSPDLIHVCRLHVAHHRAKVYTCRTCNASCILPFRIQAWPNSCCSSTQSPQTTDRWGWTKTIGSSQPQLVCILSRKWPDQASQDHLNHSQHCRLLGVKINVKSLNFELVRDMSLIW